MDVRPIRTREDYDVALDRIDALWGAEVGTPKGNELDVWVDLVAAYDDRHRRVPPSEDPLAVIRAAMEERLDGLAELGRIVGSEGEALDPLEGRRELTLPMIRALNRDWHIAAEDLIREPPDRSDAT